MGCLTSDNNIFTLRAFSRAIAATPSHRAASAAKGQGSGGPVRWRRENETLCEIHRKDKCTRNEDFMLKDCLNSCLGERIRDFYSMESTFMKVYSSCI